MQKEDSEKEIALHYFIQYTGSFFFSMCVNFVVGKSDIGGNLSGTVRLSMLFFDGYAKTSKIIHISCLYSTIK